MIRITGASEVHLQPNGTRTLLGRIATPETIEWLQESLTYGTAEIVQDLKGWGESTHTVYVLSGPCCGRAWHVTVQ